MQNEFVISYRRFSSEMYAESLIALLDEHEIPFELVSEPEGLGSVFTGTAGLPGVILMLKPEDQKRVFDLENANRPEAKELNEKTLQDEEESIATGWIAFWYALALLGSPVSMIAGFHIFTSRKRKKDFSVRYAYDEKTRFQGKLIFFFSLFMLLFGFFRMFTSKHGGFVDLISFLGSFFRV